MSGRRLALLIANDEFRDPSFQQLKAPELDASTLETLFKNPDLCNFYVKTLLNKTSYEVNQAIEEFYTDSTRTDLLLLYFSGHGIKDEEGKLYFVTSDTRRNRLRSTAIPSSLINEGMRESRSRQQLLILDCCYSGAFAKGMIPKSGDVVGSLIGSIERFQGRGRVILTASDAMQYAFEEDNLIQGTDVHSLFSSAIINGLDTFSADANKDGIITVDELYDYVDEFVTDRTPDQRPNIWAYGVQGEIVIASKPPTVTETQIPVPQPVSIIEPIIVEKSETPLTTIQMKEHVSEVRSDQVSDVIDIKEKKGLSKIFTLLSRILTIVGLICGYIGFIYLPSISPGPPVVGYYTNDSRGVMITADYATYSVGNIFSVASVVNFILAFVFYIKGKKRDGG